MITELKEQSQITIPLEIIKKLGISYGDKFDIIEKDGGIFLCPIILYPEEKKEKIKKLIKESENFVKNQPAYENVNDMFADIGINLEDV